METFKETLRKIWYILYPFLFYYAVMLIIMTIAQWAFGGDATHYVFCQLIATVFTIPSMLPFYRQGQALAGIAKQPFGISRERICHALFAAVHVNIVQFIYALILGVVLALLMDRAGNVYASMIGHMTANFIAVVRTETHWLDFSVRGDAVSWIFSLVVLGAGIVLMWRYLSDRKKQEDKEKE